MPRQISDDMNGKLVRVVTIEEVNSIVYQLSGSRAMGLDGYPRLFYQRNWNVVGPYIFTTVKAFLEIGNFPYSFTQTNITPIPKIPSPTHAFDYRPISLCNFIYNVISKVLVNRMNVIKDTL